MTKLDTNITLKRTIESINDAVNESYISRNYKFSYVLEIDEGEGLTEFIESTFGEVEKSVFKTAETDLKIFYERNEKDMETDDNFLIICTMYGENNLVEIFANSIKQTSYIHTKIYEGFLKAKLKKDNRAVVKISSMSEGPMGIQKSLYKTLKYEDSEGLDADYYPFLNLDYVFHDFFHSRENIMILAGPTGVGKTKFVTMLLREAMDKYEQLVKSKVFEKSFSSDDEDFDLFYEKAMKVETKEVKALYIKNKALLSNDRFWTTIRNSGFHFVILDDLDNMISPRNEEISTEQEANRTNFITQLLSYSDGLIPSSTKFIITTNQDSSDVDSALMRPGRLFDILSFRELNSEEALFIWEKEGLSKKLFKETFGADKYIDQAKLGSAIFRIKMTGESGITGKRYLKEGEAGISHIGNSSKKSNVINPLGGR